MTGRLRIRVNNVEVEYEGEQAFLASELLPLVEKFLALSPKAHEAVPGEAIRVGSDRGNAIGATIGTLTTLAARIRVASGPDLIIAALFHLASVDGRQTSTRQEILDRMKTASGYYKATYNNNMSGYLDKLIRANRIRETATRTYSLATATLDELEARLAQA